MPVSPYTEVTPGASQPNETEAKTSFYQRSTLYEDVPAMQTLLDETTAEHVAAEAAKDAALAAQAAAEAAQAAAEAAQAAAETAETNAETAETNAETAEANAEAAEAAAAASEAAAAASASAAATSETNAETAETNAETAETNAEAARDAAIAAQTAAETAETNAETAETNAEAARVAAVAAQVAAEAAQAAAAIHETNAETAETNAETAETNAEAAQTAAAASASAAATSASTATTQASTATTQAGIATTQAGIATTQASAAAASAAAAAASFDAFDDIYLGSKSSDPTLDNDGNALVTGQLYWNTSANALRIYDGATWQTFSASGGDMLKADNLSGLASYPTARTNMGLGTGDSPQFTAVNLGHASDTTITRTGAGAIAVEGVGVALNSVSLPHTASQYELGHASDTTLSRIAAGRVGVEGKEALLMQAVLPKTANYTVAVTDLNALILCGTNAFTLSLPAAATAGSGFKFSVRNTNTVSNLITLDPNSSETIDGKTTMVVGVGETLAVWCDGSAWHTSARKGDLVCLHDLSVSAAAFDFNAGSITTEFDEYRVRVLYANPTNDSQYLYMQVRTSGGLQATNYTYGAVLHGLAAEANAGNTTTGITTLVPLTYTSNLSEDGSGYGAMCEIVFDRPGAATNYKAFRWNTTFCRASDGASTSFDGGGQWTSATALTGIYISYSSAAPANGRAILYGVRK